LIACRYAKLQIAMYLILNFFYDHRHYPGAEFHRNRAPLRAATKEKIKQVKAEIRKMTKLLLARLYKTQSSAKKAVSKSAGYAVVSAT